MTTSGVSLNDYNYGLLPKPRNGETGIIVLLGEANLQNLKLRVQHCSAITPGGYYIHFAESKPLGDNNFFTSLLQLSIPLQQLEDQASCFYVLIVVDPSRCMSAVEADVNEYLPFIPCPIAALSLQLLSEREIANSDSYFFQLPIGRIRIDEQKVVLDESYIPPCTSVSSHIDLLGIHAHLERFFSNLVQDAIQIIQKILQKKQTNQLSTIMQKLCENVTVFTALHLPEIRTSGLSQPPIYLFNEACSLARLFLITLNFYSGSGKEELMNYCTNWVGINHDELERCIKELSNHVYTHYDIGNSVRKVALFVKIISRLFNNLARMEFFRSSPRELSIFVQEPIELERFKKRRGFHWGDEGSTPKRFSAS
jgi:hypothetical protein